MLVSFFKIILGIYLLPLLLLCSIISRSKEPLEYFFNLSKISKSYTYNPNTIDSDISKVFDLRTTTGKRSAAIAQAERDIKKEQDLVTRNFTILRSEDKEMYILALSKESIKPKNITHNDREFEEIGRPRPVYKYGNEKIKSS